MGTEEVTTNDDMTGDGPPGHARTNETGDESEECEGLKPANDAHHPSVTGYGAAAAAMVDTGHPHRHHQPPQHQKRHSLVLRRGDTDLSIDHGGVQRFLPKFMHFAFADREAEQLYQEYYSNEK